MAHKRDRIASETHKDAERSHEQDRLNELGDVAAGQDRIRKPDDQNENGQGDGDRES